MKAAREYAVELRTRWKGIGSDKAKTRDAGMYNFKKKGKRTRSQSAASVIVRYTSPHAVFLGLARRRKLKIDLTR